ncbi:WhiB family transcriptional regulator [Pseudonocardia benzenivorans]
MPSAACRGHAPLFDDQLDDESPDERTARHARAVELCRACPALARCSAVEIGLPRDVRGVWAGRVRRRAA